MAMVNVLAPARPRLSEEEFQRLPQDGRKWELVDGEAREVPTSFKHDHIVIHLGRLLGPYADQTGYLTASQAGFRMSDGNLRCPDLGLTLFERFPDGELPDGFADFAPDLCVEIISPSEERADMDRKVVEYFASGAQQVWHLFPETQTVTVYFSPVESHTYLPDDQIAAPALLPGFQSRVAALFALPRRPSSRHE